MISGGGVTVVGGLDCSADATNMVYTTPGRCCQEPRVANRNTCDRGTDARGEGKNGIYKSPSERLLRTDVEQVGFACFCAGGIVLAPCTWDVQGGLAKNGYPSISGGGLQLMPLDMPGLMQFSSGKNGQADG